MRPPPTQDQIEGEAFLRARPRAFLGDDPGAGKTRQLLEAAEGRVLVVGPAYAASVWEDEHAKWTPDLDLTFIAYSSLCERLPDAYGRMLRVVAKPRQGFAGRWDTVIFDEAHYLKGRGTKWARAAQRLRGDRVWLATGTVPEASDLWMLLRMLRPTDRELASYWRWINRWFKTHKPGWGGTQIGDLRGCTRACKRRETCEHWERFYADNLGDLFLHRPVTLDIPLTEQSIRCPMHPRQARVYQKLAADYRAWVAEAGEEVVAWSGGGLAVKLDRISTGLEVEVNARSSGKLTVLRNLLGDYRPPLVVFCWYKDTAEAAARVAREAGLRVAVRHGGVSRGAQELAVAGFRGGSVDVLVATLATTSESLNLQVAATAIFLERSWRPSTNRQAIRRLYRMGQPLPVRALHLESGPLDRRKTGILASKTDREVRLMRAGEMVRLLAG